MMQDVIDCSAHQWNMPVESNVFDSSADFSPSASPLNVGVVADDGRLQKHNNGIEMVAVMSTVLHSGL